MTGDKFEPVLLQFPCFERKKSKQVKLFVADAQKGDRCTFPLPVVPVDAGTSFLPAHPVCSPSPSAGDFCLPQTPFHQNIQQALLEHEPVWHTGRSAHLHSSAGKNEWEWHWHRVGKVSLVSRQRRPVCNRRQEIISKTFFF